MAMFVDSCSGRRLDRVRRDCRWFWQLGRVSPWQASVFEAKCGLLMR
jgi:hypothetical protein